METSLKFVRLEAEIENKEELEMAIAKLDQKFIEISGIAQPLKIKAAEALLPFPSRNEWDSFFLSAKDMDELKPGQVIFLTR